MADKERSRKGRRGPRKGEGGRPKGQAVETQHVAFRLPKVLLEQLDEHVERLRRDQPGQIFNRSGAVRDLLSRALATQRGAKSRGAAGR